ncbi:MAG: ABC transporter ATP-binding protein [Alphaproteobacteria bacterium]|nr:ABC transporter ATP-binding protein [Alphaproteobacteria bacterium]
MSGVVVRGLAKSYGPVRALRGIDLVVEPGEFAVLLGPSGCGKSSLLGAIAGLDDIDTGTVEIGGVDVTKREPSERGIAMVFQSYALYPTMTVCRNLSFGLRVRSVPKAEIERRVAWAAELLQIGGMLDRKPSQLSGGQRQRVAIGRALVQQAKVFLLDEPLSNLDAKLRTEMRVELKRLHQSLGATIIYVTHDQIEAMTLATRIAVMRAGRIEQYATPDVLYERPATLFVAGFVGSPAMNFLSGSLGRASAPAVRIETDAISLDGYPFCAPVADGGKVVFGIRPEHVSLAGRETRGPVIEAESLFIEPMGADTLAWFQYGSQRISARLPPQRARGLSGKVRLALDISQVSLFDPTTEERL